MAGSCTGVSKEKLRLLLFESGVYGGDGGC